MRPRMSTVRPTYTSVWYIASRLRCSAPTLQCPAPCSGPPLRAREAQPTDARSLRPATTPLEPQVLPAYARPSTGETRRDAPERRHTQAQIQGERRVWIKYRKFRLRLFLEPPSWPSG